MSNTMTSTVEYSVRPWVAFTGTDEQVADAMDTILTELEQRGVALGPVVSYDAERGRIDALFQLAIADVSHAAEVATSGATRLFQHAIRVAGITEVVGGVEIARGGPDEL